VTFLYAAGATVTILYVIRSDCRQVFVLDIWFIDHLNTQLLITVNYSIIADFHTSQITLILACIVFTRCFLITISNNGYSFDFMLKSSLNGGSLSAASSFKVTLHLTVSQTVSLGVELHLELMTRYLLLFDSHSLVFDGRPFWREDRSAFCQSHCLQ
jgi:hypothetical protein